MRIVAIIGRSGSKLQELANELEWNSLDFFDFAEETERIWQVGEEGYRQVVNFFGEEFLLKSGQLNKRKLKKLVYGDFRKLRILQFLMEPLLFNQLQKRVDASLRDIMMVTLPGLVDMKGLDFFEKIFWLELPKQELLNNLNGLKLAVSSEVLVGTEKKLFVRPEKTEKIEFFQGRKDLLVAVEKYLKSV